MLRAPAPGTPLAHELTESDDESVSRYRLAQLRDIDAPNAVTSSVALVCAAVASSFAACTAGLCREVDPKPPTHEPELSRRRAKK